MKRIYKYPLYGNTYNVNIPVGSEIMSVINQDGVAMVYALVDPTQTTIKTVAFHVIGTGWDIADPNNLEFVGTFQDNEFVWHVFYDRNTWF
jgi:hypothetical protein